MPGERLQGVMAFLPSSSWRIPETTQPQQGRPRARRGDAPLAQPSGDRDIPLGVSGWPQDTAGPTAGPYNGHGMRVLPRVLLQQHNHLATGHLPQAAPRQDHRSSSSKCVAGNCRCQGSTHACITYSHHWALGHLHYVYSRNAHPKTHTPPRDSFLCLPQGGSSPP